MGLLGAVVALGMALSTTPARAAATARPGTLNYVEGQADIADTSGARTSLNAKAIGSEELNPGEILETGQGKAELLLTPGVFFRLGDQSAMRMISPGLTDTRVELLKGSALVEATNLLPENDIQVIDDGTSIRLLKPGLYAFNLTAPRVAVYDGEVDVRQDDHNVKLKSGHELNPQASVKPAKFDKKTTAQQDPLYQWSSARSAYLAEADVAAAPAYLGNPALWAGTGWYWNPYFSMYTFIPGDMLFSPFGYGFYSPWLAPPIFGYGYPHRWGAGWHQRPIPPAGRLAPHSFTSQPRMSAPQAFGGGMSMGHFGGGMHR
jgi:hypothetical protein